MHVFIRKCRVIRHRANRVNAQVLNYILFYYVLCLHNIVQFEWVYALVTNAPREYGRKRTYRLNLIMRMIGKCMYIEKGNQIFQ